ncbi:hypothetical protein VDGE_30534 [Verticillium dahliae]|uniref:Uncharacterized protein n=1 Tax=Verticillium dahliae TaxID=27337 RepID=A0A444RKV9_VERDA|nr:hypothetical protein VDGE_30534 [Verticillium dahliae]
MVVLNRFNRALDDWGSIGHSGTSSLFRMGSKPSSYMEEFRNSITKQVLIQEKLARASNLVAAFVKG